MRGKQCGIEKILSLRLIFCCVLFLCVFVFMCFMCFVFMCFIDLPLTYDIILISGVQYNDSMFDIL